MSNNTSTFRHVDVAIIGAGSAGLRAYRAARADGKRALLIEGGPHGTTCARVGCMPSKLLIAAADAAQHARHAGEFGVTVPEVVVDGRSVMDRVRRERDRFVSFVTRGVDAIDDGDKLEGWAHFVDDHTLDVGGVIVRAKAIVIATGSSPVRLPLFDGLGDRLLVNDHIFDWEDLPESVAVFGPGVIGLELGQALHRLGVRVRIFGVGGFVGPLTDPEVLAYAKRTFAAELTMDPDATVRAVTRVGDSVVVAFEEDGVARHERFDYVLAATGRRPNLGGLELSNTSLELDARGVPLFDPTTGRAGVSSIFIAGDVTNERPVLHEAADEGQIAGENAARYPDVRPYPRRSPLGIVFSDPQIALVGSRFADLPRDVFVVGEVSFEDQGRSRVMRRNRGLLHVYARRSDGLLLGAEMIGPDAEHLAHLLAWAHQQRLTVEQILELPFYHPVVTEGVRTALRDAEVKREALLHDARPARSA